MGYILRESAAVDFAHGDVEGAGLEEVMVGDGLLTSVGRLSRLHASDV
jgi:hypothetical protein